ncbi:hypothetical protein J4T99_gp045 [Mycobacterium phage Bromden]|uniref:Uncharacterized protein n=1 Tax=Mycobacterium phage Bromden TaxID=2283252 RepID=A0A345MBI0_9CAUD|nr:hypothetical protein J4T99_gp045 [Mycobacterium phage Bromden]AXH67851.1 hypothetical protein SEA_BROMDEN_45 [Mycobacterium phage Bromden]
MTLNTAYVLDSRLTSETSASPLDWFIEGEGMKKFRDVINETRRVVMTNPLGRNKTPDYTSADGKPCCIFGHVLKRLGIGIAGWEPINSVTFADLPWNDWGFEEPNAYQLLWITNVQANADNGDAWVIAVAMADATLI